MLVDMFSEFELIFQNHFYSNSLMKFWIILLVASWYTDTLYMAEFDFFNYNLVQMCLPFAFIEDILIKIFHSYPLNSNS